jgi:hypothetical protein
MGVNKIGDGDKKYAAGYAAGFAEGIAAGFAASSEVCLNHSDPGSNVIESTTAANNADAGSNPLSAVTEEDLKLLYPRSHALESSTIVVNTGEGSAQPSSVSAEELAHLVPGCFVQVGSGESSYWVEVGLIEGNSISGMVHPELSSSLCIINHDTCEIARFSRDQITALGCDRYCWC